MRDVRNAIRDTRCGMRVTRYRMGVAGYEMRDARFESRITHPGSRISYRATQPPPNGPKHETHSHPKPPRRRARRLEALQGSRAGQYSIRVNDQFRLCFRWTAAGPEDVEIVDYH